MLHNIKFKSNLLFVEKITFFIFLFHFIGTVLNILDVLTQDCS